MSVEIEALNAILELDDKVDGMWTPKIKTIILNNDRWRSFEKELNVIKNALKRKELLEYFVEGLKLRLDEDSYDDNGVSKTYEFLESKSEENCFISDEKLIELFKKLNNGN